jgi:acetolactate synthase I/II/III large subunit
MRFPSGGDLLVDCLVRHGVSHVFSIIGGQMGTIYDAIGRSADIDVVTPRSETAAALMACGYTAAAGRPCVSMATVGAGVVYEVAGLAKAWFDHLPVVSIAPQVQSYRVKPHQESLQACEQDELFYPITKWNAIVFHWARIPQMVDRAFREALTGVPGPVHLDIPVDILFKRSPLTPARERRLLVEPGMSRYDGPIRGEADAAGRIFEALSTASRPLAVLGQGFGRPGRFPATAAALEEMGAPVVTTVHSAGVMPDGSACYAGDLESCDGLDIVGQADLILLVGIDHRSRGFIERIGAAVPVVQVETDPAAFLSRRQGHVAIYADPQSALDGMKEAAAGADVRSWRDQFVADAREAAVAAAARFPVVGMIVDMLREAGTGSDVIVADGEVPSLAARRALTQVEHEAVFIMDEREIPGAGLPFAIGAHLSDPGANVILICDKNSLFYHIRELQPAVCGGMDITLICVDDLDADSNVADTEGVLSGLGCDVRKCAEGERGDLASCMAGVPSAILLT